MAATRCSAAQIVGTALALWCESSFPKLPKSELPTLENLFNREELHSLVAFLERDDVSFVEAAYWLSSAYALLSEVEYRKTLALYFTPPSVTNRLLDDLEENHVSFETQRFFDPACGGAAFLAPIAERIKERLKARGKSAGEIIDHVCRHLFGTDLDGQLCALSRHFLLMVLYEEVVESGCVPTFLISKTDSLTTLEFLYGTVDVIVCNPPYRKIRSEEMESYRSLYSEVIEAQPNLYGLFIALCVRLLRVDGGTAALVTPTSFLSGQYFRRLRTYLMRHVDVLNIGMVSDRAGVFIDVEQETALTTIRRREETSPSKTHSLVSVVSRDGDYSSVGRCLLPNSGAAWPIPRTLGDAELLEAALLSSSRLEDFGYRIRIGSFVWNRDKRPVYMSLNELRNARAKSAVPLLWSSDIGRNGELRFDGNLKDNDEPRFVDLGDKEHRSVIRRPGIVLQRVTSNDQPRRLVSAAVSQELVSKYGGFVGENHTVVLEQVVDAPMLTPLEMTALLACPTVDRFFRCISGATNVSAFELRQLALPAPHRLRKQLDKGREMDEAVRLALRAVSKG